jgi:hypothetical protein
MVLLGSNGERYVPVNSPPYRPAPVKVAAKKPVTTKKKTTTTVKPSSRVVSARTYANTNNGTNTIYTNRQ